MKAYQWFGLLLFLLLAVANLNYLGMPSGLGEQAPTDRFSAGRAMNHIEAMCRQPHPMGSPQHAAAAEYLISQIQAQGLEPEVQYGSFSGSYYSGFRVFHVRNIMTRIPGKRPGTGAVALVAHYDTRENTPGAGDDGIGTAVLLECMRALAAEGPFENDLILLWTDAEEYGLAGAGAFIADHPWFEEIDYLLNFEARGHKGPAFMFETAGDSLLPVSLLAEHAPQPAATSFAYEVYKLMPNATDFSRFKEKPGLVGMNFAVLGGLHAYHTANDTVEDLSLSSLQQMGDQALVAGRALLNRPLSPDDLESGERGIYFYTVGFFFVLIQEFYYWGLVLLSLVLTFWAARRHWPMIQSKKGLLGAFGLVLLTPVVVVLFGFVMAKLVLSIRPEIELMGESHIYETHMFLHAYGLILMGLTGFLYEWLGRKLGLAALRLAVLFALWVPILATLFTMFGASYLFVMPALMWSVVMLLVERFPERPSLLFIPAFLTVMVLGPVVAPVYEALHFNMAGASLVFAVLAWLMFLPGLLEKHSLAKPLAALVVLGLVLGIEALVSPPYGEESPRPFTLFHAYDADENRAYLAARNEPVPDWIAALMGSAERRAMPKFFLKNSSFHIRETEPPPAPEVPQWLTSATTLAEDETCKVVGDLTLRKAASGFQIRFSNPLPTKVMVSDEEVPMGALADGFTVLGRPADGEIPILIEGVGGEVYGFEVVDFAFGLTDDRLGMLERPPGFMPDNGAFLYQNSSRIAKSFTIHCGIEASGSENQTLKAEGEPEK